MNELPAAGTPSPAHPRAVTMSMAGRSIGALERSTIAVNRLFVLIASALVVGIMLATVYEVFVRYVLNSPSQWTMDSSRFALLYAFFLALGPALQSGHHVSVDLFDSLVPSRLRPYLPAAAAFLVLVFSTVLFRHVLDVAIEMFETGEMTFSVVPVPLKYVYWIGPVGVAQFWLTALVGLLRSWQRVSTGPAAGDDSRVPQH